MAMMLVSMCALAAAAIDSIAADYFLQGASPLLIAWPLSHLTPQLLPIRLPTAVCMALLPQLTVTVLAARPSGKAACADSVAAGGRTFATLLPTALLPN